MDIFTIHVPTLLCCPCTFFLWVCRFSSAFHYCIVSLIACNTPSMLYITIKLMNTVTPETKLYDMYKTFCRPSSSFFFHHAVCFLKSLWCQCHHYSRVTRRKTPTHTHTHIYAEDKLKWVLQREKDKKNSILDLPLPNMRQKVTGKMEKLQICNMHNVQKTAIHRQISNVTNVFEDKSNIFMLLCFSVHRHFQRWAKYVCQFV